MLRTKKRALASGSLSIKAALVFGIVLAIAGFWLLLAFTNRLAAAWAAFGLIIYLAAYGFSKRRSVHSTLIGSLAGAAPAVVGYVAVSNDFDLVAALLFVAMALWQMPHFYSIGVYRLSDYRTAGLPILPVKKGLRQTKAQILIYMVLFAVAATALGHYADLPALATVGLFLVGFVWLIRGVWTLKKLDSPDWARLMFKLSLIVLLAFSLIISLGGWLS